MKILQSYFLLQLILLKRQIEEFGIPIVVSTLLLLSVFLGASYYLFLKTPYAPYVYILVAAGIVIPYSEIKRNEFLKFTYSHRMYVSIRIAENTISVFPFLLFLLFKQAFYSAALVLIIPVLLAFISSSQPRNITVPTPFYKKPFEFILGFRKSFPVFALAYVLTIISLLYQNFNLGIFSLVLCFLICLSFYTETENEFYVWVHSLTVNKFLLDKLKTAILFSTILTFPIAITLLFFFQTNTTVILGFEALGYCYLMTVILAKYSAFPRKLNVPQGVLLAFSLSLPPLLLVVTPFFYIQSRRQLKLILE
jgi:hypothetical protein